MSAGRDDAVSTDPSTLFPTKYLPPPQVRELPAPPVNQWRFVGALVWSVLLFGVVAMLTIGQQAGRLLGG